MRRFLAIVGCALPFVFAVVAQGSAAASGSHHNRDHDWDDDDARCHEPPTPPAACNARLDFTFADFQRRGPQAPATLRVFVGNDELLPVGGVYSVSLRGADGRWLRDPEAVSHRHYTGQWNSVNLPDGAYLILRLGHGRVLHGFRGYMGQNSAVYVKATAVAVGATVVGTHNYGPDRYERQGDGVSTPMNAGQDEFKLLNPTTVVGRTTVTTRGDYLVERLKCAGTSDLCAGVTCAAQDQCHEAGRCDPATGACSNPIKRDGAACNADGNPCTQNDSCQAGACVAGPPVTCEPLSQCHDAGECLPATGKCTTPPKLEGSTCILGDPCQLKFACDGAGSCVGVQTVVCEAKACNTARCDSLLGGCVYTADDGQTCAGEDACRDYACNAGVCEGSAEVVVKCDPSTEQCRTNTCDPIDGVCKPADAPDDSQCNDANHCTLGERCVSGVCTPSADLLCNDFDKCTADSCNPTVGCVYADISSQCPGDGDACHAPFCSPKLGCGIENAANGTQCNDGSACTASDQCVEGVCQGANACDPNATCGSGNTCQCTAGYIGNGTVCNACDPSCATCTGPGANQCASCPAGQLLQNGACVAPQCSTNAQCTATTASRCQANICVACQTSADCSHLTGAPACNNGVCAPPPCALSPTSDGLVGRWLADDNANDLVSGNNGAVLNGAGFISPGQSGFAFHFSGASTQETVQLRCPVSLAHTTVEAWVRPSQHGRAPADASRGLTVFENGFDGNKGFGLRLYDGHPQVDAFTTAGGRIFTFNDVTLPLNQWTHVAFTHDGANVVVYVNGTEVGRAVLAADFQPTDICGAIGNETTLSAGSCVLEPGFNFVGDIDDVRVYNVARSPAQVSADTCDAPCPAGTTCAAGVCLANATCTDGIQNQSETGVDCGGPCAAECPVDCVVSDFGAWSACSATCGGGTQTRTRSVVTPAANGGAVCPDLTETQACNTQACPTCADGIQNQGETGVDCGGPCGACPIWSEGKQCAQPLANGTQAFIYNAATPYGTYQNLPAALVGAKATCVVNAGAASVTLTEPSNCYLIRGNNWAYQDVSLDGWTLAYSIDAPTSYFLSTAYSGYTTVGGQIYRRSLGAGTYSFGTSSAYYACAPETCSDGIQNQGETGVDCGGPCAAVCPVACLAGQYRDANTGLCQWCHSACSTCTGPANNECTSCGTGKVLLNGACVVAGCSNNTECTSATASRCESTVCTSCVSSADCSHIAGAPVCYAGACVADACAGSPCQNGGSCQQVGTNATCLCPGEYTGTNCEIPPSCHSGQYQDQGTGTCASCDVSCATCSGPGSQQCTSCAAGVTLCAGSCVNTANDSANCGACNESCSPDQACQNGGCVCPAGTTFNVAYQLCVGACEALLFCMDSAYGDAAAQATCVAQSGTATLESANALVDCANVRCSGAGGGSARYSCAQSYCGLDVAAACGPQTPCPAGTVMSCKATELVGWWKGEDSAADSSGNGRNGTLGNGTGFGVGHINRAFAFDGVDDYVSVADAPALNFGTGDFAVAFWMNARRLQHAASGFIHKDDYGLGAGFKGWHFNVCDSCGGLGFATRDSAAGRNTDARVPTSEFQANTWYHVVGQRESGVLELFVNGASRKVATESAPTDVSNAIDLRMGSLMPASPQNFDGLLDDVRVYNRALSQGEITTLAGCTAGSCPALSAASCACEAPPCSAAGGVTSGQPATLASLQFNAWQLAQDTTSVYWGTYGGNWGVPARGPATLRKVAKAGGGSQTLATLTLDGYVSGVAVNASEVVFGASDGVIRKVPINGGTTSVVRDVGIGIQYLAVDANHVYWTKSVSGVGGVYKMSLAGDVPVALESSATAVCRAGLTMDATHVYWAEDGCGACTTTNGRVMKAPLAGGPAVELANGQGHPAFVAVDGTNVYWTNRCSDTVMKVPLTGGAPIALATAQSEPTGLAVSAGVVYWSNRGSGTVVKVATCGGTPEVLASGQATPAALVTDGSELFWANYGSDGAIVKLGGPAAGDPCSPNPCLNGGVCSGQVGSYTCACSGYYSGTHCELPGVSTPAGVSVQVLPPIATGQTPASVTYSTVTQAGVTTLVPGSTGPQPPVGFALGDPPMYYELSTTAQYTGNITVCVSYAGITFSRENSLRLFHYESGGWADITTTLDTGSDVVCGVTTSLSPFVILEPIACGSSAQCAAGYGCHEGICTALATPDGTSTLSCAATTLFVDHPTTCTLTARKAGVPIVAAASAFYVSSSPEAFSVGALDLEVGTTFTFQFIAQAYSSVATVTATPANFVEIIVVDSPDATSTFTCAASTLAVGSTTTCTLAPHKAGVSILAMASAFTVTASPAVGTLGALSPAAGSAFTFTYTAPAFGGPVTLSDGLGHSVELIVDGNDCASNPCQNGGACVEGVNARTCTCLEGFTGASCQTPLPVGAWFMNEASGDVARDSSGNGNDAAMEGWPTRQGGADCRVGGCLSFDGYDDRVVIPYRPVLRFGTGDFTVSAWVKTTESSGERIVVGANRCGIGESWIMSVVNGYAGFATFGGGSTNGYLLSSSYVADNQWHLIVGRRDGISLQLYVDGVLRATGTLATNFNSDAGGSSITVGNLDGCSGREFIGAIDDVRIYKGVVAPGALSELVSCSTATCASTSNAVCSCAPPPCSAGASLCGSQCADVQTDASHCGACGNTCATGETCSGGECHCYYPLSTCGSACLDLAQDKDNCGACGIVCPGSSQCTYGQCTCPVGQALCASGCKVIATDSANCGSCGNVCGNGTVCTNGECRCPEGQSICAGTGTCKPLCSPVQSEQGMHRNEATCVCECDDPPGPAKAVLCSIPVYQRGCVLMCVFNTDNQCPVTECQ